MLVTSRLRLRQWTKDDFLPFATLCKDKEVMEYFPSLLTEEESIAMGKKIQSLIAARGWGFWAVEIPGQVDFAGFVGLHTPSDRLPCSPCVEVGWRLSKAQWGKGYATEAAEACLNYAFTMLDLAEVVAFTTVSNTRSQAVMQKLGMRDTHCNFMHPDIDSSHPLCEHALYKIDKTSWLKRHSPLVPCK